MALSLQSQWKLVAAGMMAHADQVMAGEECERLMALVEEEVDGDEYAEWLGTVSDPDKLAAALDALPALPSDSHRAVLEEAWLMAVVDGVRDEAEVKMLETLGERLGVESVQLEFWREAWTQAQSDRAETTIRALATLVGEEDEGLVSTVLFEMPTTHEHRDALAVIAKTPQARDEVVRRMTALSKPLRRDVVSRLARAVGQCSRIDEARAELSAIAADAGLTEAEIASVLHDA
ncbi:MAG: hypothetical protein AAF721_29690 [Myxococcota bacterium]